MYKGITSLIAYTKRLAYPSPQLTTTKKKKRLPKNQSNYSIATSRLMEGAGNHNKGEGRNVSRGTKLLF